MIPAWWIFLVSFALTVVCVVLWLQRDSEDWGFVAWLPGLAAFIFLIAGLVITLERHYGRVSCHTFAAQTGRTTRFVIYSSWNGGDCLTPDGKGHWIPTKNLREFGS